MDNILQKCWWCGQIGNSGEHKFKKTDVNAEFGLTFQNKENRPQLITNDKTFSLQSSSSDFIKFEKILCATCNNNKSQKFDIAYTKFVDFILSNYDYYFTKKYIDLKDIFHADWAENKLYVYSYFVKHFCCRLARNNFNISPQIICFLNGEIEYLEYINVGFQQKADMKLLLDIMEEKGYGNGYLEFGKLMYIKNINEEIDIIYTFLSRKWFKANLYYSDEITSNNFIDLKSFYKDSKIKFDTVSIFPLKENFEIDEIKKLIEIYKSSVTDFEERDEYFRNNPYKTND